MLNKVAAGLALLLLAGSAYAESTEESNIAKCKQFYAEVVNEGNFALIDDLVAEAFVEHEAFPGLKAGREGLRQFFMMMRTAFPDLKFETEFFVADGDKVVAYIVMSGTHKGEFMGIPASGKKFETRTIDIVRIVDGKAVEHWGVTDTMTMMEQLRAHHDESGAAK
jgi:steroid delta-isomerase-like uncharacterized protein